MGATCARPSVGEDAVGEQRTAPDIADEVIAPAAIAVYEPKAVLAKRCPVSGLTTKSGECPFAKLPEAGPQFAASGGAVALAAGPGNEAEGTGAAPPPDGIAGPSGRLAAGTAADFPATQTRGMVQARPGIAGGDAGPRRSGSSTGQPGSRDPATVAEKRPTEASSAAPAPVKKTREQKAAEARQEKIRARLEQQRRQREEYDKNKEKYSQLVDDIVAGKYKRQGQRAQAPGGGSLLIKMPTQADRRNTEKLVLGQFREQYGRIGRQDACPSVAATQQYSPGETKALQIEGGHRPMPRPEGVQLPRDFRKPVGVLSLAQLAGHGCQCPRMLLSVYGFIFDVSDRPDKYGEAGPYSWMTGNDITWGFVSGKDTPEQVNQCYDLWKVAPEPLRDSKLKLIYAWVAFYEYEYGGAVGRLDVYEKEEGLKGPPMESAEDCCVM